MDALRLAGGDLSSGGISEFGCRSGSSSDLFKGPVGTALELPSEPGSVEVVAEVEAPEVIEPDKPLEEDPTPGVELVAGGTSCSGG